MIRFPAVAVALIWIFQFHLSAQFYLTGENPASTRWSTISTTHFKIIFPEQLYPDAARLGRALEFSMDSISDLKHTFRKRFPVLMQNGSILSNGFVTLAPFRMELQITPPQDLYAQDWITQLALHEFRHAAQLNKLDQGATHVLGWFTGDIARGILSSRFPSWFYEGDAVYNETRLSQSGRGRSAGFEMPLRTLLIEKEQIYSYNKMMFGSYRDFVPDAYIYGYKMTGYLRQTGDNSVWSDALDQLAQRPYQILPVAFYLKRNFGFFKQGLYDRTMESLKTIYTNPVDTSKNSNTLITGPPKKSYSGYLHNMEWNRCIISHKSGLDEPGVFVLIDSTGKEQILIRTGRMSSGDADLQGSTVIWDEIVDDPRWEKRSYSEIKSFDLVTRKQKTLTRRTRYFSPDFSDDGSLIAVVEIDTENRNYLTLIRAEKGNILTRFDAGDKILSGPEWISNHEIAVITTGNRGKQIETVSAETGQWQVKVPYTYNNISDLLHQDRFILFRADYNGIENFFALDTISDSTFQVTNSRYGVRFPSVSEDGKRLIYSEYSAEGFNIAETQASPELWPAVPIFNDSSEEIRTCTEKSIGITGPKPYKQGAHLFRFHSWVPFYTDVDELLDDPLNIRIYPGIMMLSQNLLGTAISSFSYSYERGYHYIRPSFEWRGWYPVIRVSSDIGGPERVLSGPGDIKVSGERPIPVRLNLQAYIPLAFTHGPYTLFIQPEAGFEYVPVGHLYKENYKSGVSLIHFRFMAANYRRMSLRDLYPPMGQNIAATLSFQPDKSIYGEYFSLKAGLFLPGLFRHHHLVLSAGFQYQDGRFPLPYNRVNYPRGYTNLLADRYTAVTLNYAFPVAYPDFSIGPLLYIKRFRANFFYDGGYGENFRMLGISESFLHSAGTEILTDFHPIRLIFPISAGIRVGYKSFENKLFAEFLISMSTLLP